VAQTGSKIRPGDLVDVRSAKEILQTLDADGTLDRLPFMPEMIPHCGKRYRVEFRALKTCTSGSPTGSTMRSFKKDNVVTLRGLRCPGTDHEGCQKLCRIFWREAWLRKVEGGSHPGREDGTGVERLSARLKTKSGPQTYFCQASEILNVTNPLSRWERFSKCVDDVRVGNASLPEMIRRVAIGLFWKVRRVLFGSYGRGTCTITPSESLNLRTGERIVVKSMQDITQTLDAKSHNRGLLFTPDMRLQCGHEQKVERHLDKIIVDGTGEMRKMKNTVYLEDSYCSCAHAAIGGCPRGEFVYWREIWLRREEPAKPTAQ